jgi:hypothetical protein
MKGTYIFRQNGVELGRCENVITTAGKNQIAKSIANQSSQWAGSIAIGSGASAASAANKKLNFEYARGPVNSISYQVGVPSSNNIRLTAKAALGENISGQIYEIGIFSSSSFTSQFETILCNCDDAEGWDYQKTDGTWDELININGYSATVGRAGNQSINFSTSLGVGITVTKVRFFADFDFSEVSSTDTFAFAVQKIGGSAGNITVRFYTDETNYFTASLSTIASGTNTYTILESAKSSWSVGAGAPDWSNINFIEINNPEGNIYLDGIRVDNVVAETQSILVSRSLPSTIITKVEGTPLEIEYLLDLF